MASDSFAKTLIQYVHDHPGATGRELREHFDPISKNTVSSTLGRLQREGILENRGPGGPWSEWHPTERDPVAPEFAAMARVLTKEMSRIYPVSEREPYLARRLQHLFMQEIFKS